MTMKWIGLTGGIATGKSAVAEIFRNKGVEVIDADPIAHQALVASSPVFGSLVQTFGQDVLSTNGNIDRQKLGAKIFANSDLRLKLDAIVHPFVRKQVALQKQKLLDKGCPLAIYDVPLLFEKQMQKDFDKIIVVTCDPQTQKHRLMKRNGLNEQQASQRIAAQLPMSEKIRQADFVIENNGSLEDLKNSVHKIFVQL
jgi:dephospho-CoA kinase